MRKEFVETEEIENYLLQRLNTDEKQQFEVKMLLYLSLAAKTEAQDQVYKLVRRFGRKQKRKQLDLIYQQLLQEPTFAQQLR